MTLLILPILMTIISMIGFIANGKAFEFSAEVLVAICFVLFVVYLIATVKEMLVNSLTNELSKVFYEFESLYDLKVKELSLLVDNYSKINYLKNDLIDLNSFLQEKLISLVKERKTMVNNHIMDLVNQRLVSLIREEEHYSSLIHNNLVSELIISYKNINSSYNNNKIWSDNIHSLSYLSSDVEDKSSSNAATNLNNLSNI
uniref:ATP synthase F0 subunit b n=1 Tax=Imasa heleensis TaxID=2772037 RepID=A0A893DCS6_9EUKA|nr:ATP synthase F0 subunit b [Imasa heleensis]QRR29741.1 ATP synthase F0 subunit b [Imasa heleensis]